MVQTLFGTVTGKRLAVLGCAFKADTNDTRETPAIRICRDLLEEGAQLTIFDPKVSAQHIEADLGATQGWQLANSPLEAAQAADAVLVLTEWPQFAALDWCSLQAVMRHPTWLFDARAADLKVWRVGEGQG